MAELLRERYEVRAVVARRAGVEVVRAWDRLHDRTVALEIRPIEAPAARDQVLAAARDRLSLRPHHALPAVREDFVVDGRYVLVTDWIDGVDLATTLMLRGDPGLPVSAVLRYLAQAADVLDHLHGHDPPIGHGDVRPATLVVDRTDRVVLVGGDLCGGRPPAEDVYALASTAQALITGSLAAGEAAKWEGIAPDTAKVLARGLRRGLAPDPRQRPATATELVERLQGWNDATLPAGVVTFCLTDIERSTDLWEAHPDTMASVISRHHAIAADVVEDHNGRLPRSQGEGDSTLSVFARASDAIDAALALQRALADEPWPDGIRLRVRMGVHTGEAEVRDGDYFGAAVSRTARIRALAAGGQVLLSQTTAQLVVDHLPVAASLLDGGEHTLKGLARAERVFALCAEGLVQELPVPAAPEEPVVFRLPTALPVARRPFVGRERDLDRVLGYWAAARAGKTGLALVAGDPGVGKTRLCAAFAARVHEDGATVLYGRCYEENLVSYQPFVEALRHLESHADESYLRRLVARSGTILTRLLPDLSRRLPGLAEPTAAAPETERFLLFEAVATLLAEVADEHGAVLVLDDLQWADAPTLALLAHVVRAAAGTPLLVLGTYRDQEVHSEHPLASTVADLRRDRVVEATTLRGLDEDDVGVMVRESAGRTAPDAFVHMVSTETEGNPFFVQEVLRHLIEAGAVSERDGRWASDARADQLGVPEGVKAVVGRRLARLAEPVQSVLTFASVIGREFHQSLLARVTERTDDDLLDLLDLAVAAGVVDETSGAPGRYSFAHALIHETLYGGLTANRRVRLHGRVGEAIEGLHAGHLERWIPELAHHFLSAGDARAIDYARRAGRQALDRLAHEEAATWFARALDAVGDDQALRCDILLELAAAHRWAGQVEHARAEFDAAAALARTIGDPERLAEAAIGNLRGYYSATPEVSQHVVDRLEEALARLDGRDSAIRARVEASLGASLYFSAQRARRIELGRDAVEMARRVGDPTALADALVGRSITLQDPEQTRERLAVNGDLLIAAEQTGNAELAFVAWHNRAFGCLEVGDVEDADRALVECERIAGELRQPLLRFQALFVRTMRTTLAARLDEGEQRAAETLQVGHEAGHPDAFMIFGAQLGAIRWDQGRLDEVEAGVDALVEQYPSVPSWRAVLALLECETDQLEKARRDFDVLAANDFVDLPMDYSWTSATSVGAEVCAVLGDVDRARLLYPLLLPFERAVVVVGPGVVCAGALARSLGLLATLLRDYDAGARHFELALDINERLGAPSFVARTKRDHARMLLDRGDTGDAEVAGRMLSEARALGAEIGMATLVETVDALLQQ